MSERKLLLPKHADEVLHCDYEARYTIFFNTKSSAFPHKSSFFVLSPYYRSIISLQLLYATTTSFHNWDGVLFSLR